MEDRLKWWQKTNVCEIYVRSFQDSDGDGIGDLKGITQRLDYLKKLGIGAVWITPCYPSPQADNGYDIVDYCAIDETFGTMEDLETLISEAGKRGICIVMDLVFNHTSDQHAWFLESSSGKENPKSDWYIWRDAKPDGSEPTNWRSIFGGSAWTWSETRGQYYLHTFLKEQPDLNWENPEVRCALYDTAIFWLDKGVGGFRMDAITYIKKPAFTDGVPDAGDGMTAIHEMIANSDGILDFLHEFKDTVQSGRDIFTVGEANGVNASDLPEWVGSEGVFDMVFEFSHILLGLKEGTAGAGRIGWTLVDLKRILTDSQEKNAGNGWYPVYFENHDHPRCIDHYFPGTADSNMAAKIIGTLLFTLRGTPFVYQGQELGLRNVAWDDINDYNDISTRNRYGFLISEGKTPVEALAAIHFFSRDSARTPMQWTADKNAGFTRGTPWLPVNENYRTCNVASEEADPDSILSWYRALAEIRRSHSELIEGSYEEILHDSSQIYAFIRRGTTAEAIILTNFSEETAEYDAALLDGAALVISSAENSTKGMLEHLESAVYKRKI
ncbi:MAG: alpha-glucosidase [Eubacteriales bacterium]|nr:alpha-glucosidase [Eubacteriales bacterium]